MNNTFDYNNLNIIPLICYEIIFPELIQKIKFQKNNLIINISEDGWFGENYRSKSTFF